MNNKSTEIIIYIFLAFSIFIMFILCIMEPPIQEDNQSQHVCTTFEEYRKRKMVTPFYYQYKDTLRCVECGKDYKE